MHDGCVIVYMLHFRKSRHDSAVLHRDRKKVLRALIPFMISIVYLILTIYIHSLGPMAILLLIILALALFGMLRPKKNILSFCFVPFEEEESSDALSTA